MAYKSEKSPIERVENQAEAWEAAHAEKPIRDLAREKGVDEATKKIFDQRAEQKSEEVLQKPQALKNDRVEIKDNYQESKQLINPELYKIRKDIEQYNEQLNKVLGDENGRGERPFDYHFNKEGDLIAVKGNGLEEGDGKLGKILQIEAKTYYIDKKTRGSDEFIVRAYHVNPEVKRLLDESIALIEKKKQLYEKIERLEEYKKELYSKGTAVNEFFEKIGWHKRVPEKFDFKEEIKAINEMESGDEIGLSLFAQKIVEFTDPFEGLEVDEKQIEDFGIDLRAIEKNIMEEYRAMLANLYKANKEHDQSVIDKKLKQGKVIQRAYYGSTSGGGWLYRRKNS